MTFSIKSLCIIVLLSLSSVAISQDLSKKTKEELKEMKSEAVAAEDFGLAKQIKQELESRKSVIEFQEEYESELESALKNEDYKKAALIKGRLQLCDELIKSDSLLQIAIENEDYEKAQKLKDEKEEGLKVLKMPLGTNKKEASESSLNDDFEKNTEKKKSKVLEGDKVEVIFKFNPIKKNILKFVDIFIDKKYVGSIGKNSQLVLSNIEKGTHQFIFNDIEFDLEENAVIEVLGLVKTKFIDKNKIKIDENTIQHKMDKKLSFLFRVLPYLKEKEERQLTQEQNFGDIQFPAHDSPFKAKYNVGVFTTNIPSYFNTLFNFGYTLRTPLNRNLGLISGGGYHITIFENIYNGSTVRDMFLSYFGVFGYRFEFSPGILLRPDVELGFSMLSTNSGNEFGLHSKLNLGVGFQFGKAKAFGLLLEPSFQFGGGPGFSIGFFTSGIKYPEKRHLLF